MVSVALQTVVLLPQVQNSKHPSLHHGLLTLQSHTFQVRPGPAGGQVWTTQVTGRRETLKHPESLTRFLCVRVTHQRIRVFQNVTLPQQMVESIKQEPMECAIEQPPLKKIKQEVLFTRMLTNVRLKVLFFCVEEANMKSGTCFQFVAVAGNVGSCLQHMHLIISKNQYVTVMCVRVIGGVPM